MNEKRIKEEILELEKVVEAAKELHAITFINYDSFVESSACSNDSEVYKTMISVIERKAYSLYMEVREAYEKLNVFMREKGKEEEK